MSTFDPPFESPFVPYTSGDRIQHARRVLAVFLGWDVSQGHLADYLGVPTTVVKGLEGDSVDPRPFLEVLSAALGVHAEYIASGGLPMTRRMNLDERARWRHVLHGLQASAVIRAPSSEASSLGREHGRPG